MDAVKTEVDKLYKAHFGKLVASLLYSSRDIDPETAEDIVHDSFSAALIHWQSDGIPVHAAGWIYKVCRNNALNHLKKNKHSEELKENTIIESEHRFSESVLDDQQLKLLFACAHPDLSPKIQVVITLKYVANLRVEAIARTLAMTIDGIDKLLLRARQKIKDEKILLDEPIASQLQPRLSIVHKIIYLIFNEGHKSSSGKELLREDLCEEALLLNKALIDHHLATHETFALQALMLFNIARFKSRFGFSGELLNLEKQDRSLWDHDLILLACDFLKQSQSEHISTYHIEASIAFLHSTAASFDTINWKTIADLYTKLLHENPNPFVELNFAIARYYAGEKDQAFDILNKLLRHPFLNQYYLLNSALGKFHYLEGNHTQAKAYFLKALDQTTVDKEKDFIRKMIDELED